MCKAKGVERKGAVLSEKGYPGERGWLVTGWQSWGGGMTTHVGEEISTISNCLFY